MANRGWFPRKTPVAARAVPKKARRRTPSARPAAPRRVRRKTFGAPPPLLAGWEVVCHDRRSETWTTLAVKIRLSAARSLVVAEAKKYVAKHGGTVHKSGGSDSRHVLIDDRLAASFHVGPHVVNPTW